jgi:hypothetical protein
MTLTRAFITWLLMIPVAFGNGVLRQFGYGPYVAEAVARQISCITAIILFGALIVAVSRRWKFESLAQAWRVGILWACLTAVFETSMGRLRHMSWGEIFQDYEIWNGRWWGLVIAFLASIPAIIFAMDTKRIRQRTTRAVELQ